MPLSPPAMVAFDYVPATPDAHAIAVMLLTLVAVVLFSLQRISLESSGLAVLTALVVGFQWFPYRGLTGGFV